MNSAKTIFIIAMIAIGSSAACKRNSAPDKQTAGNQSQEQFQHPQGGAIANGETKYFKGSIGSTLGLQMKLLREGDKLTGSYFYQKVGTRIELRGTVDAGGSVALEEFDPSGKSTGSFKGTWKTGENGLIEIEGNWAKPNGDKKTPFSLTEEPIEFSNGVEIVAREIHEKNKKLKYEVDAEYPQLTGSTDPNVEKFNQTVRALVMKKIKDFKAEMEREPGPDEEVEPAESTGSDIGIGYTVALANDDLVSIQFDVGSYESGAVHPNSYSEVLNFDLRNGRQLKLSDLFQPGSKYLQALSAYAIKDLKRQSKEQGADSMFDDDWIQRGAGADAENFSSWTTGKKGLGITFDSYQVAPYAAGPQSVFIPYSALKDIIKPDGPVGQFVK